MRINLRKALALMISLLMLCTLIPMGAMTSVSAADAVLSLNWNDGTVGFSDGSVVAEGPDGSNCLYYSFGGGYSSIWKSVSGVTQNTTFVITFKAKASVAGTMGITIQKGDWSNTYYHEEFTTTTEWTEYSITTSVGEYPTTSGGILFKFQDRGTAMELWIDDLVMTEYVEPEPETPAATTNLITNGDFETGGTTGWSKYQSTAVNTTAAYEGTYGVNLVGNGGWGGMLNQAIAVEDGKTYTLSFWYKTISVGVNWKIYGTSATATTYGSGWISKTEWTYVEQEFVVSGDTSVILNFNGGGNGTAESVYVDNIMLTKAPEASFDGYFYNGDFEIGTMTNWTCSQTASISANAAHTGSYGAHITNPGGQYGGMIYQGSVNVVAGRTYTISLWMKVVVGYVNIQIKDGSIYASTNLASTGGSSTSWKQFSFTVTPTTNILYLSFCGGGTGTVDEAYVDDVLCERVGGSVLPEDLISYGGSSIRDNSAGTGLAFRFMIDASNGQKDSTNQYVESSAKITLDEVKYDLVRMGAIMTNQQSVGTGTFTLSEVNGTNVIDIEGKYLAGLESDSVAFAVRILDIPTAQTSREIYARPYYVYLEDGVEKIAYGDIKSNNYDKASNPKASIKVLSIGSSFSKDVMVTYLYNMFKAGGYDEVVIGYLYMGGCSIVKHLYNAEHNLAQYEYGKNENGTWVQTYDVSSLEALQDEDWDYVTIHGSSDYIGGETISKITLGRDSEGAEVDIEDTTEYDALPKLVEWVKDNVPAYTKIEYHMIWAYSADCDLWSFAYHDYDQMTMYNKIINNTSTSVRWLNDIDGIIPSGTSIQNGRTSLIGDNFNEDDGYHLNSKYGDYTAALTWYSFFSGDDASVMAGYTGDLSAEEFEAIAEAVNNAMNKPYAITESTHK